MANKYFLEYISKILGEINESKLQLRKSENFQNVDVTLTAEGKLKGTIEYIKNDKDCGKNIYFVKLKECSEIFLADTDICANILIYNEGDKVTLKYYTDDFAKHVERIKR